MDLRLHFSSFACSGGLLHLAISPGRLILLLVLVGGLTIFINNAFFFSSIKCFRCVENNLFRHDSLLIVTFTDGSLQFTLLNDTMADPEVQLFLRRFKAYLKCLSDQIS